MLRLHDRELLERICRSLDWKIAETAQRSRAKSQLLTELRIGANRRPIAAWLSNSNLRVHRQPRRKGFAILKLRGEGGPLVRAVAATPPCSASGASAAPS
jgi:hypothetical protein